MNSVFGKFETIKQLLSLVEHVSDDCGDFRTRNNTYAQFIDPHYEGIQI